MKRNLLVIIIFLTVFINIRSYAQTLSASSLTYCQGNVGVGFRVESAVEGNTYILQKNSAPAWIDVATIENAVAGTNFFPGFFLAGNYRLKFTTPEILISQINLPENLYDVTVSISTGGKITSDGAGYCNGSTSYPSIGLSGSQPATAGVIYKLLRNGSWYNNLQRSCTGSAITFGPISDPGIYTIKAERLGCSIDMTGSQTISIFPTPNVGFTPAYLGPPDQCGSVTFTPSIAYSPASTATSWTYNWTFGSTSIPSTSTLASPTCQFPGYGTATQSFPVSLQITDNNGCAGTMAGNVTVQQRPDATVVPSTLEGWNHCNSSPTETFPLTIINKTTTPTTNTGYLIDWDDPMDPTPGGIPYTPAEFPFNGQKSHTYTTKGVFHLKIVAFGPATPGCNDTKIFSVFNGSTPTGGVSFAEGILEGCMPHEITFWLAGAAKNNAPTTFYYFDFGDGTPPLTFTQENMPVLQPDDKYYISHTYNRVSCDQLPEYSFTMNHYIANPCATIPQPLGGIKISRKSDSDFLRAEFPLDPIYVCAGVPRVYTNNTNPGCIIYGTGAPISSTNYYWDFYDDGTIESTLPNPTFTFPVKGLYQIRLKTFTGEGVSGNCGQDEVVRTVCVQAAPVADFIFSAPSPLCVNTNYTPDNNSTNDPECSVLQYEWTVSPSAGYSFTGGTDSHSFQPTFNFSLPGVYTITLTVTVNSGLSICNTATAQQILTIISPPSVTINAPVILQCGPGLVDLATAVTYNANQGTIISYLWEILPAGATISDVSVPFPVITVLDDVTRDYTLKVTVANECGITISTTFIIRVTQTIGANTLEPPLITVLCSGMTIGDIIGNVPSGGMGTNTYQWFIDEGPGWAPIGGMTSKDLHYTLPLTANPTKFKRVVTSGSCVSESTPVVIFVVLTGIQNNNISSPQVICSGAVPSQLNGTTPTQGTGTYTYKWQQSVDSPSFNVWDDAPGPNDGLNYIPGALTQTTKYRRIVYSGVCNLTSGNIEITVNPIPVISSSAVASICSDVRLNYQIISTVPGTVYSWAVTDLSGGDVTGWLNYGGGPATIIPDLLINNNLLAPKQIQYTIVPTGPIPTLCPGSSFPLTVTVKPKFINTYTNQTITVGTSTILNGSISGGTSAYTYSWEPVNKLLPGNATLPNPETVLLNASQTYTVTVTDAALCQFVKAVTITTGGLPLAVTLLADGQIICEGTTITLTANATGGGVNKTFTWGGLPSGAVYLSPSSVQLVPENLGANVYTVDVFDTYAHVTASITITVNKKPSIISPLLKQICSGDDVAYVPESDVLGTTYRWVRGTSLCISTPSPSSGTGTINNVLTNNCLAIETIDYLITPIGPSPTFCEGAQQTLTVEVMPVASITTSPNAQTINAGQPTVPVPLIANVVSGVNFRWEFYSLIPPTGFGPYLPGGNSDVLPAQTFSILPGGASSYDLCYKVNAYIALPDGAECPGPPFYYHYTIKLEPAKFDLLCPVPSCEGNTSSITLAGSEVGVDYQLLKDGAAHGTAQPGCNCNIVWADITESGTYTVLATNTTNLVSVLMNNPCVVVFNPNPVANYVIGSTGNCVGDNITLNGSEAGVLYELFNGGINTMISRTGPGALDFGPLTIPGIYTIKATFTATGCWVWIDGQVLILPLPLQYLFTPAGPLCAGTEFSLANSQAGIWYSLVCTPTVGTQFTQGPWMGGLGPINFGPQFTTGVYKVLAYNPLTGCDVYMADEKVIWPNPVPYNITPVGSHCGMTEIGLDNSETGFTYHVYKIDPVSGLPYVLPDPAFLPKTGITGQPLVFGSTSVPWTYCIIGFDQRNICRTQMNGLVTVMPNPAKYQMLPTGTLCFDQNIGVEILLEHSDIGIEYTLFLNGVSWSFPVGGIGPPGPLSFGFITVPGTYTINARNTSNDCIETMYGTLALQLNPVLFTLNPQAESCPGVDVWLSGSEPNVTYTLHPPSGPLQSLPGDGNPLHWGPKYQPGNYYVTANSNVTTCNNIMNGIVKINSRPGVFNVRPQGINCEMKDIGLENAEANTIYEIVHHDGSSVSPPVTLLTATAGNFWFLSPQPAGIYKVKATTAKGCDTLMSGEVVIDPRPTADAGPAIVTICNLTPYTVLLSGTATDYSSVKWSSPTNPSGSSFIDQYSLSTTYTFTPLDILNKQVVLTLKSFGTGGCANAEAADQITVNILALFVDAGPDQSICDNETVTLAGSVTGGTTTGVWSGGAGVFTPNRQTLNAVYDPDPSETGTTVTLTLVSSNASPCPDLSDAMNINIYNLTGGMATSSQTICNGQTPLQLTAAPPTGGSSISNFRYNWQQRISGIWTNVSGATNLAFAPSALISTTEYRQEQTDTYCNPDKIVFTNAITITVNNLTAGTIATDQTICENETASLTGTLPVADGTIAYQWQSSLTGLPASFGDISGATSKDYATLPLTADTWYQRIATSTLNDVPCSKTSNVVKVTVNNLAPGTIAMDQTICENAMAILTGDVPASDGAIAYQWQSNTTGIPPFSDVAGATSQNYTTAPLTADTWYQRTAISTLNSTPCSKTGNIIKVTVNNLTAGTIATDQTICENETASLTGTLPVADGTISYQWQSSLTGLPASFGDINGATSKDYTTLPLTEDTWYQRISVSKLNAVSCTKTGNIVKITVNNLTAGTVAADQTICENGTASLTGTVPVSDGTITYQWQLSTTGIIPFGDISGATTANYATLALTADTWYQRVSTSTLNSVPCSKISNIVKVTVNNLIAGAISMDQTICEGAMADLTGTLPTSDGTISFQWQSNTTGIPPFSDVNGATSQNYTTDALTSDTWYRRVATSTLNTVPCSKISNIVKVTVNNLTAGTIATDQTVCENQTASLTGTIPVSDGTVAYQWQSSLTGLTSSFGDISGATSKDYATLPLTADTWYHRIATSTLNDVPCSKTSNVVKVTVNNLAPGTIAMDQTICENAMAILTGDVPASDGAIAYQWQSNTTGIPPFSDVAGATSQNYTTAPLTADTWYQRTAISTLNSTPCSKTGNIVKVTVNNLTAGTIATDQTICENETASLTGTLPVADGTIGYQWQSSLTGLPASFGDINGATSKDYTTLPLTEDTWYQRISVSKLNAVSCTKTGNIVKITVNNLTTGTIAADQTICENGTASLTGTVPVSDGTIAYQWQLSTTGIVPFSDISGATTANYATLALTADTWYQCVSTSTFNSVPCSKTSNIVKITVNNLIAGAISMDQTICEGAMADLTGTLPTSDGTISFQWQSNTTGIPPFSDVSGATSQNYTTDALTSDTWYRRVATSTLNTMPCSKISNIVKVTVNNLTAGTIASDQAICENQTASLTGTVPVSDGTIAYQWQSSLTGLAASFANISGATSKDYSTLPLTADTWYHRIATSMLNSVACEKTSNMVKVTVNPLPHPTIGGPLTACIDFAPPGYEYTTQPGMTNYTWSITGGIALSGGGGAMDDHVSVKWTSLGAGKIVVNYTDPAGCMAAIATTITVNVIPPPIPEITSGPNVLCLNDEETFVTQAGMTGYVWYVSPGGIIGTGGLATDNFITVHWTIPGSHWISINFTGPGGCPAVQPTIFPVTVTSLPTPTVTGSNSVCEGDAGVSYFTEVGNTGYNWTTSPGGTITGGWGTNRITVIWNTTGLQNVSVSYTNIFNCTAIPTTYPVMVNPLPVPQVNGSGNVCSGSQGNVYTTEPFETEYFWTVSSGGSISGGGGTLDNSVTVTWSTPGSQTVSISYTDFKGCGAAIPTIKNVFVHPLPMPQIMGDATPCLNTFIGYTTESGKTGYTWNSDGTILIGSDPFSVTAKWSSTGPHWISVKYTDENGCTNQTPFIFNVNVALQTVPVITGPAQACVNSTGNIYATVSGKSGYIWTVTGGVITAGSGTNSITVRWETSGNHSVSVQYIDGDCSSATTLYPVVVNVLPIPVLNGDNTPCLQQAGYVYTTDAGKNNYTWDVSSGGLITAGGNDNTVTVTWNVTGAQYVSVSYIDPATECGSAGVTLFPVTVQPLPIPSISGVATVCVNSTGNIYSTQGGMSGYNWTVTGGNITSGSGTSTIAVTWSTSGMQQVCVNYSNSEGCDAIIPACYNVNVHSVPVPSINGPATVCHGDISKIYSTQPGMTGYVWTISAGGQIMTGDGTNTISVNWYTSGTQTISVNYTNSYGCISPTATDFDVLVNDQPVADFTADAVCQGSVTTFTDLSDAVSGLLVSHLWDFGDGQTSSSVNPTHLYATANTYSVNLTVANSLGCIKDTTILALVMDKPIASFSYTPSNCAGDSVQFNDLSSTSHGYIHDWTWDFGDGTIVGPIITPNNQNIKHKYTNGGNYNVILMITTSDGCTAQKMLQIHIQDTPLANFIAGTGLCAMTPVQFTDLSQLNGGPPITAWDWNFGDPASGANNNSTVQNATHVFSANGDYTVHLTVTNANGCIDTISKPLTIIATPMAGFTVDLSCIQSPTQFTDASTTPSGTIVARAWNFGDPASGVNNTSTLEDPTHIFNTAGTYWVTLQVTNSDLCVKDTSIIVISNPKPIADFQYASACQLALTQFTDLSIAPNSSVKTWEWDFGDNGTANIQNPSHVYQNAGTFNVKLIVTNLYDCKDSITKPVVVRYKPLAAFNYHSDFCPANEVDFQDSSQVYGGASFGPQGRTWYFEPGYTANTINPTHHFTVNDTIYNVTLMVNDNFGCRDTIVKSVNVKPGFDLAFDYDTVCFGSPTHFKAINRANGDTLYSPSWDFGDPESPGNYSTLYEPEHQFTRTGTFVVWLKAWNSNNCVDSIYRVVRVSKLAEPDFLFQSVICKDTVRFVDNSKPGFGTITSWKWIWGDGTPPLIITPPLKGDTTHRYVSNGTYPVKLIVTNSLGCTDSIVKNVSVTCIAAAFTQLNPFNCSSDSISFRDFSSPVNKITNWHWDFGDTKTLNYTSQRDTIRHKFDPGTFLVSLTVQTVTGSGTVSSVHSQTITINAAPVANFAMDRVCFGNFTSFVDLSLDNSVPINYREWQFGDGANAIYLDTLVNPRYQYLHAGVYSNKFIVKNIIGCRDSLIKQVFVSKLPIASFTTSPPCQRYDIEFTDGSVEGDTTMNKWWWNFNDPKNPFDTLRTGSVVKRFDSLGTYPVYFKVMDNNGCVDDTIYSNFEIKQSPIAAFTITENINGKPGQIRLNNESSNDAKAFKWSFGNGKTSNEVNPIVTYISDEQPYTIELVTWNTGLCYDTTYLKYEFLFDNLFVPNAFSPTNLSGGLGCREFRPKGLNLRDYHVMVFDKWGHLIWESKLLTDDGKGMPLEAWDGTFNGEIMPQDVYMWKISATFSNGKMWEGSDTGKGSTTTMGTVTLIR